MAQRFFFCGAEFFAAMRFAREIFCPQHFSRKLWDEINPKKEETKKEGQKDD